MSNSPLQLSHYVEMFASLFPTHALMAPWELCANIQGILTARLHTLSDDYLIQGSVAIHKSARVEEHVVLKGPLIIEENCFVGAHAYLRGGVYLAPGVSVGPGCELKSSFMMPKSATAHFNFVGDSIVGSGVNMEAGSIIANHYNERTDKAIHVLINGHTVPTGVTKFGALVGDGTRIGANAVLSPGTVLEKNSVVKRLELVAQVPVNR